MYSDDQVSQSDYLFEEFLDSIDTTGKYDAFLRMSGEFEAEKEFPTTRKMNLNVKEFNDLPF